MQCHLYLTGYRGTGKTSTGKELASSLNVEFYDLDAVIQQGIQRSIAEVFATEGEAHFRDLETHYLRKLSRFQPSVISLGGGTVLREGNRQIVASTGRCVWLQASPHTILARLNSDAVSVSQRPALTNLPAEEEIVALLASRHDAYEASADYSVMTDNRSPQEIATVILDWWRSQAGITERT